MLKTASSLTGESEGSGLGIHRNIRAVFALAMLMAMNLSVHHATAAELIVAPDAKHTTIQSAIDSARDGDEILIASGIWYETIDLRGKAVLLAPLDQEVIIDADGAGSVIRCVSGESADTVIEGLVIRGGLARRGAGLLTRGSNPTIRDCVFQANESLADGGAWAGDDGGPIFDNCLFLGNVAGEGDTFSCGTECTPLVLDCRFVGNCPQPKRDDWSIANASNLIEQLPETCEQALDLFDGPTPFATVCAATERPGHAECELEGDGGTIASDIWYRYVPAKTGLLRLGTCADSDFDTDLAVYRGECDRLELIGCNDDAPDCPGGPSELLLPVRMDDTLLIRLGGGIEGAAGTGHLEVHLTPLQDPNHDADPGAPRGGSILQVCSTCDYTTIQSAVDAGASGDIIYFLNPGTYFENVDLGSKAIGFFNPYTLGQVIIDGGTNGPAIRAAGFAGTIAMQRILVRNGVHDGLGGGLSLSGSSAAASVEVYDCRFENNVATYGGGIGAYRCRLYMDGTELVDNFAQEGGGLHGEQLYALTSKGCVFDDNLGGGVHLVNANSNAAFTFRQCSLERNTAYGIQAISTSLRCTNCLIAGNGGTGIDFDGNGAPLHVLQCTIAHNAALSDETAGIKALGTGDWRIENSIVWGNQNDFGRTFGSQLSYDSLPGNALLHVSIEESFSLDKDTTIIGLNPWGDPLFEDPCGPDGFAGTGDGESYRLLTGSAALDAGNLGLTNINIPHYTPDVPNEYYQPMFGLDGIEHDIDIFSDLSNPIGIPATGPTPDLGCYELDLSGDAAVYAWSNLSPSTSSWLVSVNWLPYGVPAGADGILLIERLLENSGSPTGINHTVERMHIGHGDWIFSGNTSSQLNVTDMIQIGQMTVPVNENPETPEMSKLVINNGFNLQAKDVLIDGHGNGELLVTAQDPDDGSTTDLNLTGTMTLVRGGRFVMDGSEYDSAVTGGGTIENLEGVFERMGNGDTTIDGDYIQRTPPPGPIGQKYPTAAGAMIWDAGTQLVVTGNVELGGVLKMSLDSGRGGGALPILECQTPGGLSGQVVLQTDLPSNLFFKVTTTSSVGGGSALYGTITPLDLVFGLNGGDETNPTDLPIDVKLVDIDLDPDGLPDLAFVMDENLVVMFNQGDLDNDGIWDGFGVFGDAVTVSFPGSTPTALDVGDYDGKGPLDIVVSINAGPLAGTIQIVQDITAPGPIIESVPLNGSADPVDVCLFDLDDDDDLDIIVASEADATLRLVENDGTRGGTRFATEGDLIPLPDSPPFGIDPSEEQDSKDSDNAGILVSSRTSNTGKFFRKQQGARAVGLELEATVSMNGETVDMAVGDFDENGIEDFVTLNRDTNSFSIFLREESDSDDFTELSGAATIDLLNFNSPESVDAGDFDNDGDIDLVIIATPNVAPGDPVEPPVARIWFNTRYANGDPIPSQWMTFVDSGTDLDSSGTPVLVVAGDVDDVGGDPSQIGDDVVILGSVSSLRGEAGTITPNVGGPSLLTNATELVAAFDAATDGSILTIAAGTYELEDRLDFGSRNLTLVGAVDSNGLPTTTIVASASNRALWMTQGQSDATRIENIIIEGGESGAGIYMQNTANPGPVLINCIIRNCSWHSHGAGIRLNNAHPSLVGCTIRSCICTNSDEAAGGGVYLYGAGSLTATDCVFDFNQATSGGAIYADQDTNIELTSCDLDSNSSSRFGGAIHARQSSSVTASGCDFTNNSTSELNCAGGGIYCYGGDLSLTKCLFQSNVSNDRGGGVAAWNGGTHQISNCVFDQNATTENDSAGGGLYLGSCTLEGDDNVFESNRSRGGGGAWFNSGVTLADGALTNWIFRHNLADVTPNSSTYNYAGALFINGSSISLANCEFHGNSSDDYCGGLMINDTSDCEVISCLFEQNDAARTGGAMYVDDSSNVVIQGSTFTGNSAVNFSGAIHLWNSSPIVDDCSITGNQASGGGAMYCNGSSNPTVQYSTICGNSLEQVIGSFVDVNNCISELCDSDGDGTLDCIDGCPNDPDKTTPGDCGCGTPDEDADGDGITDCLEVPCDGDLDKSGSVNVTDLLGILSDWGPCTPGTPCNGDVNDDGTVDVTDLLTVLANWGDCPLSGPWAGCTGNEPVDESDYGCDCFVDGDDFLNDCNAGSNGDGSLTPYTFGSIACGNASIFQNVTGDTYRDTDWWDDGGVLDAGGTFTLHAASGASKRLGIVDLDTGTFVDNFIIDTPGQWSQPYTVELPPGNYCLWIAPTTWNSDWTCDSGLAEYSFRVIVD